MKFSIQGEQVFQPLSENFGISASNETYTLHYSADGVVFTALDKETPAGENHFVINVPKNVYFKCVNNASKLTVSY